MYIMLSYDFNFELCICIILSISSTRSSESTQNPGQQQSSGHKETSSHEEYVRRLQTENEGHGEEKSTR